MPVSTQWSSKARRIAGLNCSLLILGTNRLARLWNRYPICSI